MPSRYLRYAAIPGFDLSNATKEDVDEMRANVKALTTGWLYGRKPIEYAPEKLSSAVFSSRKKTNLTPTAWYMRLTTLFISPSSYSVSK